MAKSKKASPDKVGEIAGNEAFTRTEARLGIQGCRFGQIRACEPLTTMPR